MNDDVVEYTVGELRRMIKSPNKLPHPDKVAVGFPDAQRSWAVAELTLLEYQIEYWKREATHLQREKILLRAALEDDQKILETWNGVRPRWSQDILELTKDK